MPKPTFRAAPVRVRVPATSANLGPGFDALGLALSLYDDIVVRVTDEPGLAVDVAGMGAASVARNARNLVVKAMYAAFKQLGGRPRGLEVVCANRIPHGRGLGSSAAAIVGGVMAARTLVAGGAERMSDEQVLSIATEIEGHPDNVAACLYGGLTVAWSDGEGGHGLRLPLSESLTPVLNGFIIRSSLPCRRRPQRRAGRASRRCARRPAGPALARHRGPAASALPGAGDATVGRLGGGAEVGRHPCRGLRRGADGAGPGDAHKP